MDFFLACGSKLTSSILNSTCRLVFFCRSQTCVGSSLPPYKVGNLNSKLFLSEISKREKSLKRTLEGKDLPKRFTLF